MKPTQQFMKAAAVWDNPTESLEAIKHRIHDDAKTEHDLHDRADVYSTRIIGTIPSPLKNGCKILEIGSGVGYIMQGIDRRMKERGISATITGLDVSSRMLELAKDRIGSDSKFNFLQYDGINIELPDESLDFVYSVSAIQHIPKPYVYNLFFEIKRLLRPGGSGVIHFLAFHHLRHGGVTAWRDEVSRQLDERTDQHWGFYYSADEMIHVLEDGTGFKRAQVSAIPGDHAFVLFEK